MSIRFQSNKKKVKKTRNQRSFQWVGEKSFQEMFLVEMNAFMLFARLCVQFLDSFWTIVFCSGLSSRMILCFLWLLLTVAFSPLIGNFQNILSSLEEPRVFLPTVWREFRWTFPKCSAKIRVRFSWTLQMDNNQPPTSYVAAHVRLEVLFYMINRTFEDILTERLPETSFLTFLSFECQRPTKG